jgi:hypothetical protein
VVVEGGRDIGRRESARTALVIGAGVSGCACAAALVERGVRVRLVNSALDRLGHPGYGPEVISAGGWAGIVEAFGALPRVVRDVWVEAGVGPAGGGGVVAVDRRRISIELKRALESLPGLELRQGLVNDVRLVGAGGEAVGTGRELEATGVAVETVFGEVFEAEAVVVAVGLGLGGVVVAGEDVLPGGRYGETRAEGLVGALERLGARTREEEIKVGPRFLPGSLGARGVREVAESLAPGGGTCAEGQVHGAVPLSEILREEKGAYQGSGGWSDEFPPTPHWTSELQPHELYSGGAAQSGEERLVLPDGCALGEVYVWPDPRPAVEQGLCGRAGGWREPAVLASRLGQTVRALVVTDLGHAGRLRTEGVGDVSVWVTGRAGGSVDYLRSLQAGTLTGVAVAEALGALSDGPR